MAKTSHVTPRAGTYRLQALVIKEAAASIDSILEPYHITGTKQGTRSEPCGCRWRDLEVLLNRQLKATLPFIVRGLQEDNAAARMEELQALWDLRWQRLLSRNDQPADPRCAHCAGTGARDTPFFGAFDYFDPPVLNHTAWAPLLRQHDEADAHYPLPRSLLEWFESFSISSADAVPESLYPANPAPVSVLLSLCERGYMPVPDMVLVDAKHYAWPAHQHTQDWQLRVWELLASRRHCEAVAVRVACMGELESRHSGTGFDLSAETA